MESVKKTREIKGISQRNLADLAGISYKSLQLIEGESCDPKLSTLERIASALDYPPHIIKDQISSICDVSTHSIRMTSARIYEDKERSWKIWLFNFVDAFRENPQKKIVEDPPVKKTSEKIKALLASTVETLCAEQSVNMPWWCEAIGGLDSPWFLAEIENLKAMALVESPVHFRKRNIFVLENFLKRA